MIEDTVIYCLLLDCTTGCGTDGSICGTSSYIMNTIFREAIERLMQINPVAEHIDLKDHYLAFIDLEKFGIDKQIPDER